VLTYKRLETGQFSWPQIRDGLMRLSRAQFEALFEGLDWRRVAVPLVCRRPLRQIESSCGFAWSHWRGSITLRAWSMLLILLVSIGCRLICERHSRGRPRRSPRRPFNSTSNARRGCISQAEKSDLEAKNSDLAAKNFDLAAENAFLKEAKARLEHLVHELRRARFGPRSEKLDPDQQQLAFEDIEITIAEVQESVECRPGASDNAKVEGPQRRSRTLPKELPRIEQVIEPASIACPCGCGTVVNDLTVGAW
jgi:Transposase C of IS166 homeodomain/IS66 Orf2 like protein